MGFGKKNGEKEYLAEVVLVLEHAFAWLAVGMTSSFRVMLIARIFCCEGAITILAFPVVIGVAVPLIAMGGAGVDVLIVAVIGEPAIAGVAVWHFDGMLEGQLV
jgi:hypothetical protein